MVKECRFTSSELAIFSHVASEQKYNCTHSLTSGREKFRFTVNSNCAKYKTSYSQGGRGNFTYLLEGQIHFALKLIVRRPIKQF